MCSHFLISDYNKPIDLMGKCRAIYVTGFAAFADCDVTCDIYVLLPVIPEIENFKTETINLKCKEVSRRHKYVNCQLQKSSKVINVKYE
jgi:hypothetical protein